MIEVSTELKSHFLRLYHMAITDDNFSPLELKMLYQFAEDRNISSSELDKILLTATDKMVIPESVEKRIEYLFDLARMIWADGIVTEDEKVTLNKYCRKFGFLDENIQELSNYLLDSVEKGLTKEEILNQLNS